MSGEMVATMDEIGAEKAENAERLLKKGQEIATRLKLPLETVLPYLNKKFPNPVLEEKVNVDEDPGKKRRAE